MDDFTAAQGRKDEIRRLARARRDRQEDRQSLSLRILDRLFGMPEYTAAATLLSYLDFRSEVATAALLAKAWADGKQVAVPYCVGDRLEISRLESWNELAPGTLGIREPRPEYRTLESRRTAVDRLDLIVVPGLAFDPGCGRIGYGKGYYDRLLRQVAAKTSVVAIAFQCQIFPEVPILPYDVRMDKIVTQTDVYQSAGPRENMAQGFAFPSKCG